VKRLQENRFIPKAFRQQHRTKGKSCTLEISQAWVDIASAVLAPNHLKVSLAMFGDLFSQRGDYLDG